MSEERESAELAMARALDGRPMPEWKPTRRAATDAPWIIKALRQEGYEVRPAAHPQEQALDVERIRARVATLWHFGGEGDACDGSEAMWCQACWDDTASLVDSDTHLGLYREADAELARLSTASEPGEPQP